ncbi:MAG: RNA 3'-phosphate cyclase [Candidatus Diapherotrites archaeon CG08_land_8_20_14_0_20_34_12]|nr:MAG: RNA 3'-phosphate cyclase [Candidatus Diapherotrites archaeon CG08_land_8_20_14_0_20_34_12]
MLSIDGAHGESGGQILRTTLALSALLQKEIEIKDIRKGREKPGLRPQHLAAVKTMATVCNANVLGLNENSTYLKFNPTKIQSAKLNINISTAGSAALLLQQLLPVALLEEFSFRVVAGTDVPFSPSINYLNTVFCPVLKKAGAAFSLESLAHGYYPIGKGRVVFNSKKAKLPLKPINISKLGNLERFKIFSHSSGLPMEVAENQLSAAKNILSENFAGIDIIDKIDFSSRKDTIGSGIDIFAYFSSGTVIGTNALGKKGIPATNVGQEAADKMLTELKTNKACDSHLADQLILYMALAKGKSKIECTKLTNHTLTNIWVTEQFLPVKFEVLGNLNESAEISVEGIGFVPQNQANQ